MAPNAEEELLVVKPWGPQPEKERLRPPTYNAEDYALALRRWGKRPMSSVQDSQGTLPSTTSSSSGYVSGSGEMTLRQFTSVSELLNKLRADLRLAFPSFVQEFASPPADGITLLLETLRGVQLAQSTPPSSGHTGPRIGTRRAALDELGCVECLAACSERCTDAPRLLIQAHPGLLALAVCLTSSLNRSRVLALQLLTKVCQTPGGHSAVSEAVSTLRLRYGEGGRFRFLAGALLAPRAAIALRVAGVSFLNAFLKSASRTQTKLYIQAEACEAGLEPKVLQGWLTEIDSHEEDALTDLLHKEVQKWTNNCVDVESLQRRVHRAEETCRVLSKRVSVLQNQLQKMQLEKINDYNLQDNASKDTQKVSSNAEDEGISSSERSSSPEELKRQSRTTQNIKIHDNDQETTIDDVIEELRIIVKDAEEEFVDKSKKNENGNVSEEKMKEASIGSNSTRRLSSNSRSMSKSALEGTRNGFYPNREGSLKIVVKGPEMEEAIIPAILHPQPPRRTPPCLSTILVTRHCDFVDTDQVYNSHDEEETLGDGSDSLLSASRLRYNRSYEPGEDQPPKKDDKNVRNEDAEKSAKLDKSNYSGNYYDLEANAKRKVTSSEQTSITFNKQFEASKNSGGSRHSSKYRSEVEKRKLLRRTTSHDLVNSSATSSPRSRRSGGSKIEGHIRKFESLNSFDDQRSLQNYSRYSETRRSSIEDVTKGRMKRSESFHHVSQLTRNDKGSSKGGSDSGLFYVTNFDLEPFVTNRNSEISQSPNLTKSLDRIDEGLDSMVDIIITEEKQQWMKTQSKNQQNKVELRKQEKLRKTSSFHEKQLKSDELYVNSHLRSDELYDDTDRIQQWNYFNEFNKSKKHQSNNFAEVHKARNDSGKNRGFSNRGNESGIFLPTSKPYDVFGLGKNRFNAGKYSGDRIVKENNGNKAIGGRTSSSSQIANRGKVTDVLSGLY